MSFPIEISANNVFFQLLTISTKIETYKIKANDKLLLDDELNFQDCGDHDSLPLLSAQNVANHVLKALPSNDTTHNKIIFYELQQKFRNFHQIVRGILDFIQMGRGFANIIGINSKPDQITKKAIKLLKIALPETRKLQELKYLLNSKNCDNRLNIAKLHTQLLGAQKNFIRITCPLYAQLSGDKKAHDIAGNAGLFQAKSTKKRMYDPLEIMPSCASFYSKELSKLNKELQSLVTKWYSSSSYEDRDKLTQALTDYTKSIEIPHCDIPLAKQMVKAHFLHVTSAKLCSSDDITQSMSDLINFYPSIKTLVQDPTGVHCNFLRSHSLRIMLTITVLIALFPKVAIEKIGKQSIEAVITSTTQIWKYAGGFDQNIFNNLMDSFKSGDYKESFLNYSKYFRESFLQKFSLSYVLKHLETFKSDEFVAITHEALSAFPKDVEDRLRQKMPIPGYLTEIGQEYGVCEKNEKLDYAPQFKTPTSQNNRINPLLKSSSFHDSEDSLVQQFSAVSINDCHEIQDTPQDDPALKFNNFYSIISPRVSRWFYPSAISIFKNDIKYIDLSKNRYFEMIVRHAFSKAVDRYVQTHFIEIQSKTAVGPCTLFIAKGLIQIDDQEFDGFFEYVVTPEGELIHRYFSDPKDTRSHRRADELLDNFFYDELPEELQGEWSVVGLKAKEQETKDYVVISEEFTVNQIKKNVSIYIDK